MKMFSFWLENKYLIFTGCDIHQPATKDVAKIILCFADLDQDTSVSN